MARRRYGFRCWPALAVCLVSGLMLGRAAGARQEAQRNAQSQAQSQAQSEAQSQAQSETRRPLPQSNRWQEDWSAYGRSGKCCAPADRLKYIALPALSEQAFLSLGLNLRERWESADAAGFGAAGQSADSWLLQRLQAHADLRFDAHWRVFVQIEDVRSLGKRAPGPADRNPLDLRLAFLAYVRPLADGWLKLRAGRQDFAFDLQRFASLRDGPNVRQSFDALWADVERGRWRLIAFASQPVQYRAQSAFDDRSDRGLRFHMFRAERQLAGGNELSAFHAWYAEDGAGWAGVSGNERRRVTDLRFAGKRGDWDWDLEAMGQRGRIAEGRIRAWAVGARLGLTFADSALQPRLGLQMDAASGDRRAGDAHVETFNPLFPNGGYYFTLAGYTGYANLLHVRPSLSLRPLAPLKLSLSYGLQWRQSRADAVYLQPAVPLAATAGAASRWTGAYTQVRGDWTLSPYRTFAIEAVRFEAGAAVRAAGGRDAGYLGVEYKWAW
ncbi:alginate export family protein [Tahibacter sp. P2K]|uniref:Alginate export family protein n=1 Tax=Tahibacter harae TaxID=2963937 RepID=A0ABT1QMR6_9GAMM|nr:alginate export family protein [Tahibacter harae]